jgi:hypothetical protein
VEFEALVQRALAVRAEFAGVEVASYGREWTTEEAAFTRPWTTSTTTCRADQRDRGRAGSCKHSTAGTRKVG